MQSDSRDGIEQLIRSLAMQGHGDPAAVLEAIAELFDAFPAARDGRGWQRQAAYVKHLADLPIDTLRWACSTAILECTFLPSVAELRAKVVAANMRNGGVLGSETAWERVMRMVGKHGTATLPPGGFGDPITDTIMTGPVWRQFGQTETDMLPSERKAFVEAYRAREANMRQAAQRGTLPALPPSKERSARKLVDGLAAKLTGKEVS
jgi:hypothetical protein